MQSKSGREPVYVPSIAIAEKAIARRQFLRLVGAGSAALAAFDQRAMAGPFERADFAKLVPEDKKLSEQWVRSLFNRGAPTVLRGEELQFVGMPIGGIGAGHLYLGGDGKLWHWDIFNTTQGTGPDHYAHPVKAASEIEQGFGIRISIGGKETIYPLDRTGFKDVEFVGQYPIGSVQYKDAAAPVAVKLEAFSPFIPLATDDSSLPATVFHFTITNLSAAPLEVTLAGWLQNAILKSARPPLVRRNRMVRGSGMDLLSCSLDSIEASPATQGRPDIVWENWDKDNYDGWKVEGSAFGVRPATRSEVPAYMGDLGGDGGRFVNSHVSAPGDTVESKDAKTGRITSRPFHIERAFINFWIGGGQHPDKTCINLLIDGKRARSATGANANRMRLESFDVSSLRGKQAVLEIVDAETGPWGNIGVGTIVFSDRAGGERDPRAAAGYGTMGLALLGGAAEHRIAGGAKGGFDGMQSDEQSVPANETLVGAIGRKLSLAAGQSAEVDFVLVWHFPNLRLDGISSVGRHYAKRYPSAQAVAQDIADRFSTLHGQTRSWRDTWYDSTLPFWFLDRTFLNTSILATSTCYRFADGRFYAWEGVGCCQGTCTHVWHYAHAMARLFPDLERETRQRVDLGIAFDASTGVMGFRAEFDRGLAVDGQAGTLLRVYREHQMSADDAFLRRNWPKIRKAYEPLLKLDGNDEGILEGGQMNTLDEPWYGKIPWLSSLYLAAIQAGGRMARAMQDDDFADRCKTIGQRGSVNLVGQLFNGEYFFNQVVPDKRDSINSGTGCEIDQVFGQSWAFQVHLGRVLPEEATRTALRSLWKYNFTPDVGAYRKTYKPGRWYAMPGEAGLLMCTFPRSDWDYDNAKGKGPDWAAGYFNECMNGFEHQVAGHMIWEGLVQEGLAVERAIHDRYSALQRNPWNEIECGDHYSRSMASYGVYLAACGYEYHGPDGYLAFAPRLSPDDFRGAFTVAEGWGSFSQQRQGQTLKARLHIKFGKLRLRSLELELPGASQPRTLLASLNGVPAQASHEIEDRRARIRFATDAVIQAGGCLEVVLS